MAVATGTAALIAGGISAGASLFGSHKAQKSQEKSSDAAIAFAKEQEAEKKREWEAAQKAAQYQWQVQQANLAPYRAARASVLGKYGINTNVEAPPMPEGWGMPGSAGPSAMAPRGGGGGMGGLGALGLGLGAGAGALQAYLASRGPQTMGPGVGGSGGYGIGAGGPGYAMSPLQEFAGPPTSQIQGGQINPQDLTNWENWNNYLGGN